MLGRRGRSAALSTPAQGRWMGREGAGGKAPKGGGRGFSWNLKPGT